jgi:phosphotransferase system enzyme I (PtsI)
MKGIVAAAGMALEKAHIVLEPDIAVEKRAISSPEEELKRLGEAISECGGSIESLMGRMEGKAAPETVEILDFQLLMLEDTDFIGKIEDAIRNEGINAEYALKTASESYIEMLEAITDNDYLRERAADVADLSLRLTAALMGVAFDSPEPEHAYIAVGEDIAPSRMAAFDKTKLKGVILEKGGLTSHCVILAKGLGIPCLIKASGILAVPEGAALLLDAVAGEATLSPGEEKIRGFERYVKEKAGQDALYEKYLSREQRTLDGARVKVFANITTKDEAAAVAAQGGEGVGLLRSELLYMSQKNAPPSEEKQYAEYAGASKALGGMPLVIRTLDIGGDKQIGYMDIGEEQNPFLGYRAIRYCLDNPELFETQLAAILRAGAEGDVLAMFPMVTNKTELLRAKGILEDAKEKLKARGAAYDAKMKAGIMIETPAAAFDAKILAKYADFFSIGTNDLTQYLYAADRGNAKVADLNSSFLPGAIRVIWHVVQEAKAEGIEVDICGQAAEIDALIPLWVAMGVDALSVPAPRIKAIRARICSLSKADCEKLLERVLALETAEEAETALKEYVGGITIA